MPSAVKAREVFSKLEGAVRVHPFALNGRVMVMVAEGTTLTQRQVEELLEADSAEFTVRRFRRVG